LVARLCSHLRLHMVVAVVELVVDIRRTFSI
jgi:hypothetical protein